MRFKIFLRFVTISSCENKKTGIPVKPAQEKLPVSGGLYLIILKEWRIIMEIERKFLIKEAPLNLENYSHFEIEQGYLCTSPVLRIRQNGDSYIFTYKSDGLMSREELEVPLTKESYEHLLPKCDGSLINKTRYQIPEKNFSKKELLIELDVFHGKLEGLILAEVEFDSEEEAYSYTAPAWFTIEVTSNFTFHNSHISNSSPAEILHQAQKLLNEV